MISPAFHDLPVHVEPAHIDFMGHVNNAIYLEWIEAAVLDHWRRRAPPEALAAYVWVAVKHEITYRQPAFLGGRLVASVVLERFEGESVFYETMIRRDDEVLAHGRSRWCCLDARTLSPSHLEADAVACFLVGKD